MFPDRPTAAAAATGYQLFYNNPFSQRVIPGWYQNTLVFALDLGEIPVAPDMDLAAPLYIPITGFSEEGTPLPVEGQYYIFSRLPTSWEYTGFCQVVFVEVPSDYRPNTLRSQRDVKTCSYDLLTSNLVLLLPIL